MDLTEHNRQAWNAESCAGGEWSTPVDSQVIRKARRGEWNIVLTPRRPVPKEWFGDLLGKQVLCLASGGGQQAPVLAAVGAKVVSFDLSDNQLAKDQQVAERDDLEVSCVQGSMNDLSAFAEASFDLIFHPVSNLFIPDVLPIWRECYRVLKTNGVLLAGFMNPSFFLFDHEAAASTGQLLVQHALPYREPDSLDSEAAKQWQSSGRPAEFSHSLESQIGGQLAAGFSIAALYEDGWDDEATPLNRYSPMAIATRSIKPPNQCL